MILSSVVIMSTLGVGTFGVSLKAYREQKRKKAYPWTVMAERRGIYSLVKQRPDNRIIRREKTLFSQLREQQKRLFSSDMRQQQLAELSSGGKQAEMNHAEKEIDRCLIVSFVSLGLTSTGTLFYPPLAFVSLPALLYLTSCFFRKSFRVIVEEKRFATGIMDILFYLGTLLTGHYFAASLLYSLYFLSLKLLLKTEDYSQSSLIDVFSKQPRVVWIQKEGVEVEMPFESVEVGDIVVVHAGATIPVDGKITSGQARVDQRALTGESQPLEKEVGDEVFAGTVLLSGRICIQVEKAGRDTVGARIGEILNATADFKSTVQSRGQTIIDQGAKPTLALSLFALPLLGAQSALTILYASFGYQMRVAAPLSVLNYLRIISEKGVLIKDGRSLELLSTVDTFIFDKTGTLTEEVPTVGTIYTCHGHNENEILTIAAAAEEKQTHPIALAIRQEAHARKLILPIMSNATYEVGYGLKVDIQKQLIRVGSARFMEMEGITIPTQIKQIEERAHDFGHSLVYVAIDQQLGGAIELKPTIRPEAKQIIRELQERNMEIVIISGDSHGPTKKLAEELGIQRYFAEVLPQNKAEIVEKIQQTPNTMSNASRGWPEKGKSVCFIGDGINDSIALKKANVSISLRGASTAATDTASIVLMDGTLNKLIPLLQTAQDLDRNLKQSTIMTIVPGVICVGGVFFLHFGLISAILLYNTSLISSVSNAMWPLFKHQRER